MEKKISIKTLYLLLLISLGLVGLGIGSTYAMFIATAEINNPITIASNLSYNDDILEPIQITVPAGELISTTLNITNNSSNTLNYVAWYSVGSDNILLDVGVSSDNSTGIIAGGGNVTIDVDLLNSSSDKLVVMLGVSSGNENVTIDDSMIPIPNKKISLTLINHISNLYKANVKNSPYVQSEGSYYYAPDVRLMNDGLDINGSFTNDINSGNIRYYGEDGDELKNYLYFNCDDYSDTTTCETWRILGIIDGKIKIMKNSPIEELSWDTNYGDTNSGNGPEINMYGYENDWNTSSLRNLLNGPYYDNLDTTYYNYKDPFEELPDEINFNSNSVSSMLLSNNIKTSNNSAKFLDYDGCYLYSDECDEVYLNFETDGIGITDATKTHNLISNSTWYVNKIIDDGYYPYEMYINEQTGSNTLDGNIALIDYSDYLFSFDLKNSSSIGWIDAISENAWLLSSSDSYDSYSCYYDLYYNSCMEGSNSIHPVIPTLYLDSELSFDLNTDGSSTNPYKLIVE